MKIFVTGATGYVGAPVAERLRRAGHQVVGLARSDASAGKLKAAGIEVWRGDLAKPDTLIEPAQEADAVVHAGFAEWDIGTDKHTFSVSTKVDRAAVEAMLSALKLGAKFIYTSGTSIYGGTSSSGYDESVRPTVPAYLSWRLAIEDEVLGIDDRVGIVLRPPLVYGNGASKLFDSMIAEAKRDRCVHYVGTGERRTSSVHVEDLATAYQLALETLDTNTLFNVADGRTITMRELAELVAENVGSDVKAKSLSLEEAAKTSLLAAMLASDNIMIPDRIKTTLNWRPSGPSIKDELIHGSYRR